MERIPVTSTVLMRLPTPSLSRSRRMVSTSGSSGIVLFSGKRWFGFGFGGRRLGGQPRAREALPCLTGRGLLGLLLGPALAPADRLSLDADRGDEALGVVGALGLVVVA